MRMRATRRSIWLAATASCVMSACNSGHDGYFGTTERRGKDETTFYANNFVEPEYLDPGKANDTASTLLVFQMFEGLTSYDAKDLHPVQGVATRWEQSDDNRRFRFHLRPEARWSDGAPVRAQDFEYAWKRALRPSFASLAASTLYPLKNGELYSQGKLVSLAKDVSLSAEPRAGSPPTAALAKGTPVIVLARSPMRSATSIAPLAELPGVTEVTLDKADAKMKTPDVLTLPGGPAIEASGGEWKNAEVMVTRRAAAVDCNGASDHWFEVVGAKGRGFLPGCALERPKGTGGFALVTRFVDLPTFGKTAGADPPPAVDGLLPSRSVETGFVEAADLVDDDSVVGVRATDDLTLEVELERSTPYFTDLTSYTALFPVRRDVVERFERRGEPELWFRPENIVVNGPYTLESWKFRYEITMKRNPHYWDRERLRIHRIVWFEVEESNSTLNLYKAGDLDYLGDNASMPAEHLEFVATKKDFHRFDQLATYWYELNVQKPPLDDQRVRHALNLAVDKRQLVDRITRGGQQPATHYVPEFTGNGYAEQVASERAGGADPFMQPDLGFDPARGRALLAEAGYPVVADGDRFRADGFPPLEILYNTSEGHRQVAVAIQDMWKRHLGITVSLRNEEWKVMLKNLRDGHFQIARLGWSAMYNHPHTFLDNFLSHSPQNRTRWADRDFDELLAKAAATADRAESIRLYRLAEERAVRGMARIPLYFYTKPTLVKPWVKGFRGNVRNMHYVKWLAIEPDWRTSQADYVFPSLELPPPGALDTR